jgi:hypothetical protein
LHLAVVLILNVKELEVDTAAMNLPQVATAVLVEEAQLLALQQEM